MGIFSCKEEKKTNIDTNETVENISSDLEVDHFNIWVKNPREAKEKLIEIGFTSVPDSLSEIHKGQGTSGMDLYFLQGYL